jgi:hypothetical protein
MLVLSLEGLIETASETVKNLTGNISSFDDLLAEDRLQALDDNYSGVFAYLAFFPGADQAVTSYVRSGTLASDSTRDALVLFSLDEQARWPTVLSPTAFDSWLHLDATEHPSYAITRALFAPHPPPSLPLLIMFDSWTRSTNVIGIGLADLHDEAAVRERLRKVFSLATPEVAKNSDGKSTSNKLIDDIAARLAAARISYLRSEGSSVRERLWQARNFVADHFSEIVAVVGTAAPLVP